MIIICLLAACYITLFIYYIKYNNVLNEFSKCTLPSRKFFRQNYNNIITLMISFLFTFQYYYVNLREFSMLFFLFTCIVRRRYIVHNGMKERKKVLKKNKNFGNQIIRRVISQ